MTSKSTTTQTSYTVIAAVLTISPIIAFFSPRLLAFVPAALGLISFAIYSVRENHVMDTARYPLGWFFAFLALGFASTLWTVDANEMAFERCFKMAGALIPAMGLLSLNNADLKKIVHKGFPIATIILAGLLSVEFLTDAALYKLYHTWPDTRGVLLDPLSDEPSFNFSSYNRMCTVLTLMALPAFIMLRDKNNTCRYALRLILCALTAFIFIQTESQSAQVGLIVIVLAYALNPTRWTWVYRVLQAGLALSIFTLPLLMPYLFETLPNYIDGIEFFQNSYAGERLEIWNGLSRLIQNNPLLGYGIGATRFVPFETSLLYYEGDIAWHPHNFILQFWLEFGVIGAALGLAFLLQSIHLIRKQPYNHARLYMALLLSVLAMSLTSYDIWQGWWLGTLLITYKIAHITVTKAQ